MLHEMVAQRSLPDALQMKNGGDCTPELWPQRKGELLELLADTVYGHIPACVGRGQGIETQSVRLHGGKALSRQIAVSFRTPNGEFSLPLRLMIPVNVSRPPVILHIGFDPIPNFDVPEEEILDRGFALAEYVYTDAVNDRQDSDFTIGLAGKFSPSGKRRFNSFGKISLWAYAASRILDYLCEQSDALDTAHIALLGHSRLGKTTLWTAAHDERFWAAVSVQSGFGGAAIAHGGHGERVEDFIRVGSIDWFCKNFSSLVGAEDQFPCDQHMLLGAVAPRPLLVCSAAEDRGADPDSEFLSCVAASRVYELLGKRGLCTPDALPPAQCSLFDGQIGYFRRNGTHDLTREDWNAAMDFLKQKLAQEA